MEGIPLGHKALDQFFELGLTWRYYPLPGPGCLLLPGFPRPVFGDLPLRFHRVQAPVDATGQAVELLLWEPPFFPGACQLVAGSAIKRPREPVPVTHAPEGHVPMPSVEFAVARGSSAARPAPLVATNSSPGVCSVPTPPSHCISPPVCWRSITPPLPLLVVGNVRSPLLQVRDEFLDRSRVPHPLQCPLQKFDRRVHLPFPQLPQQLFLELGAAEILATPRRTHRFITSFPKVPPTQDHRLERNPQALEPGSNPCGTVAQDQQPAARRCRTPNWKQTAPNVTTGPPPWLPRTRIATRPPAPPP